MHLPVNKKKVGIAAGLLLLAAYLLYCVLLSANNHSFGGRKTKRPISGDIMESRQIIDYGDHESMLPHIYYHRGINHIFAVPVPHAVGTIDLDNAVSILRFKDKEAIKPSIIKKDFLVDLVGPYHYSFLPRAGSEEIGFSLTREFILSNIKTKDIKIYTIDWRVMSGNLIGNVKPFNGNKRMYVFEMLRGNGNDDGEMWKDQILQILKFHEDSFDNLGEKQAGKKALAYTEPWTVHDQKVFIYTDSTTSLAAYDQSFSPADHPLVPAFNAQDQFRCLEEIAIHPSLPFAVCVEVGKWPVMSQIEKECAGESKAYEDSVIEARYSEARRKALFLLRWDQADPQKQLVPLITPSISFWGSYKPSRYSDFSFSPDGKWLVFRDESRFQESPVFVAIPIQQGLPAFLGKPILLGHASIINSRGPSTTAWATDPTTFVMCDGSGVYTWELENVHNLPRVEAVKEQ